jgi:hypothetical protein
VQNGFEPLPVRRGRKRHVPQAPPVHTAIRLQHVRSEGVNDGSQACGSGQHHLPRNLIGIDDRDTERGKHVGHRALAAGDAAGESDPVDGPVALP